jgi:hypothetical protein
MKASSSNRLSLVLFSGETFLGRRRGDICICREVIGLSTKLHSIVTTDTSTSCLFIFEITRKGLVSRAY